MTARPAECSRTTKENIVFLVLHSSSIKSRMSKMMTLAVCARAPEYDFDGKLGLWSFMLVLVVVSEAIVV